MAGFLRPLIEAIAPGDCSRGCPMSRKAFWAGGALLGAGLMALFDPNRGRRRRVVLRDKAAGAAGAVGTAAGKTWRDLRNRAGGVAARGRALLGRDAATG